MFEFIIICFLARWRVREYKVTVFFRASHVSVHFLCPRMAIHMKKRIFFGFLMTLH